MSARVLVADDEPLIRQSLQAALAQEGYEVAGAGSGAEAWRLFEEDRPDAVLLDLRLGDVDGLDLLARMKREAPEIKVLVISAHGSIQSAVGAMKLGAYDFVKKPFDLEEVLAGIRNALRTSALERRLEYLDGREKDRAATGGLLFRSQAMARLVGEAAVVASNPVPVVLVTGESGTGKQLVARFLHDRSARAAGPFVELNSAAIPESLVESELFGYERGAFSDARERKLGLAEIADGGTLFLDEIGDLGPAVQAKVLTFIEQRTVRRLGATGSRRVDVRIVAATNRNLQEMVAARSFRQDLWYRIGAMTLRLPPLRERSEDVAPLAEHFLAEAGRQFRRRWRGLLPETLALLARYPWPGNVRELKAVVHRAALMHDAELLAPSHLPAELAATALAAPDAMEAEGAGGAGRIPTLAEAELSHIRRVLDLCGGNRTLAAQRLGITRQTLSRKLGGGEPEGGTGGP